MVGFGFLCSLCFIKGAASAIDAFGTAQEVSPSIELTDDDVTQPVILLQSDLRPSRRHSKPKTLSKAEMGELSLVGLDSRVNREGGVSMTAAFAEFLAMTFFVIIGCGSAMGVAQANGSAWILQISLTFGFAITSLAYAIGHYSGGQINCAVTLGLVLIGNISVFQGFVNFVAQILGSLCGAAILANMYPFIKDKTGSVGSNAISEGFSKIQALLAEFLMTFLLMYVVLETAVNPASEPNRALACVAIGIAVFLAHTVLIPIDGCSINPTRSIGPALIATYMYPKPSKSSFFADMWVFWVGPLLGASAAALIHCMMVW